MNYGQVRDMVLKLLNQYTVAGTTVAPSYNCQQDYLNRIPVLVNDAMTEIATTVMKIPVVLTVDPTQMEVWGDVLRFELPEDFYQMKTGGTIVDHRGHVRRTTVAHLQGRKYVLFPKDLQGTYTLEYYRYPTLLPEKPFDETELDNELVTHMAIPYYVAAQIVCHDNAFLYASFYNKYEDKLAKMSPGITAECVAVADVYDHGLYGGEY